MKILLTGFEPFGGDPRNPALEAVRKAAAPEGCEFVRLEVPTVFGRSVQTVTEAILREKPDVILMIGQAGSRRAVTPEKAAINWQDARIPDNDGQQPKDQPVVPEGPAAYFSTLPVGRITEALLAAGIPAAISTSAGSYVCNHLFYGVMHFLAERGIRIPAGFMHVPYMTEQLSEEQKAKFPSLAFACIVRAVEIAAETAAEEQKS